MSMSDWPSRWDALREACESRKATGRWLAGIDKPPKFEIAPPAREEDVSVIETQLNCAIPSSFRRVLLEFSSRVCIEWALPAETTMPEPFEEIWAGECRWDLQSLPPLQATYREWIENCFTDNSNAYDKVWYQKFPILEVGNGDFLGMDINDQSEQPVVYLSHDDGSAHGFWLGLNFEDYVDRLSMIGCVGSEGWQLSPFLAGQPSLLQTQSANAKGWRAWFGLDLQ
jgi:SMI1 / KNR4 family (SUKH-1)